MRKNIIKDFWMSRIGLGLIFCYCVMASIFDAYFAQIHLTLPFLSFPIFLGEILLFICLVLFLKVYQNTKLFNQQSVVLLGLYFGWVFIKALINFYYDGPLTARNAALFYYPIFAVFAYCFYQNARISRKALMSLVFLAMGVMLFKLMVVWCWWTYVTLFVIAVLSTKSVKLCWLGWIFLAVIFLLGKEYFYQGPRAHFVSVLGAIIFLAVYFEALFIKQKGFIKAGILFSTFFLFFVGYFIFADRDAVHSLTSLRGMVSTYQAFDRLYQEKQVNFKPQDLSVHLYNPKKFVYVLPSLPTVTIQPTKTVAVPPPQPEKSDFSKPLVPPPDSIKHQLAASPPVVPIASKEVGKVSLPTRLKNIINNDIVRSRIREGRELGLDENNIVFRLFVWRDMVRELVEQRAWWGFSFGHPQRSRSLEVLHWAETEWGRDGWITPHNSFFHIVYRAGILGVGLIGVLLFMMGRLVKDFFNMNSIEGGFLVGGLVYWLVLSNFFVILEFPYNAIIFWTLFGITWAYRENLKTKVIK